MHLQENQRPVERSDVDWIQTYTGRQFWPFDPRPDDVEIIDVAHALANTCRYTGHTRAFYSVAQHCCLASINVPPADEGWALLHDASEAYLCDVARPVKRHPAMAAYREAEERLERVIAERFGLSWPPPASIKHVDRVLLRTERRDLMNPPPRPWSEFEQVQPLDGRIFPVLPQIAEARFIRRFNELFPTHAVQLGGVA